MSKANSGMTLHSLVLISDSFSCNCNSIQIPLSIVHLRVILTFLIPLLRVYINQHSSNAYSVQFKFNSVYSSSSSMYSNVTTSTRINILQCTYVHLRLFYLRVILQGFVDPIMQQVGDPVFSWGKHQPQEAPSYNFSKYAWKCKKLDRKEGRVPLWVRYWIHPAGTSKESDKCDSIK